ncbi:hypothetical protein GOP47_0029925 [Adiantum capillus-veneris]|nr:hypothetical protein GOP47_0029925 [Adiantum capillus-veneris]
MYISVLQDYVLMLISAMVSGEIIYGSSMTKINILCPILEVITMIWTRSMAPLEITSTQVFMRHDCLVIDPTQAWPVPYKASVIGKADHSFNSKQQEIRNGEVESTVGHVY